jgi:hypothetical protein
VVIEEVSIDSENVTEIDVLVETEVSELVGEEDETVGAVVSGSVPDEDEDEDEDELPKSLSFPENPHPEKYIKMGSKKTNNFNLANIRTPFQIQ